MASTPKFKGDPCKQTCQGHRAGYKYVRNGGTTMSQHSSSFNNGMLQFMGQIPTRIKK